MSPITVGPTASQATRGRRLAALVVLAVAVIGLTSLLPSVAAAATQEDKTQFSVAAGSLSFSTAPGMPTLSSVTLNGSAQTTNSTMTNVGVADATGTAASSDWR